MEVCPLNGNELHHNVISNFYIHLNPLLVCSMACVLSRWLGSSGVLSEPTGSLLLLTVVLAVLLLTMVSCLCPRQWEFEGQQQLQIIRLCVPSPRGGGAGERGRASLSGMFGAEKERGDDLEEERGERGKDCPHFDAKVI